MKCAEVLVTQITDFVGSDLAGSIQCNSSTCPTNLPLTRLRGGFVWTKCDNVYNDASIHDKSDEEEDRRTESIVQIFTTNILVERETLVPMKGDLGRATTEIVHFNGHFGSLNKCNDIFECECEDMKAKIKTSLA